MQTRYLGLIELTMTAVLVLGFGLYQLRSVNRSIAEDRKRAESDAAGHAVGEHPLDDR